MTDEEIVRWVAQAEYLAPLPRDLTVTDIYAALTRQGVKGLPPAGTPITRESAELASAAAREHLRQAGLEPA